MSEDDGTYQIWSSGSNYEEMCRPTHGVMFAKHQEEQVREKMVFGGSFHDSEGDSNDEEGNVEG